MFSVDFPFSNCADGAEFMQKLEQSGMVTAEQLQMIGHENAKALLRI